MGFWTDPDLSGCGRVATVSGMLEIDDEKCRRRRAAPTGPARVAPTP